MAPFSSFQARMDRSLLIHLAPTARSLARWLPVGGEGRGEDADRAGDKAASGSPKQKQKMIHRVPLPCLPALLIKQSKVPSEQSGGGQGECRSVLACTGAWHAALRVSRIRVSALCSSRAGMRCTALAVHGMSAWLFALSLSDRG
jgi:hypothetical protein